jgi:hypothetical protein
MGSCPTIMAVLQENRIETAVKVQDVLTQYGCHIRVRLGLNDGAVDQCSKRGLILLQLCGENFSPADLERDLLQVPDVKVKYMTLDF